MPFVLNKTKGGELELVAKTVMRKKNFSTSNTKLSFESYTGLNETDFAPTHMKKISELIFSSSKSGSKNNVDNMWIPLSSTMFKRVFPKEVRGTFFHVTSPERFEQLYKIQNGSKSISAFANMSSRDISQGVQGGSGIVVEMEGNALASAKGDMMSIPIVDGRRLISFSWFRGPWGVEGILKLEKDFAVLLKALIRKHASPTIVKKRTSPYFTDFEVWGSIRNDYVWEKGEGGKVQKAAGKKMQQVIKDYLDGVERIFKRNAEQVQNIFTRYLKHRKTDDNWDEIVVDRFNIKKVYVIADADTMTTPSIALKFEKNIKNDYELPVEIIDSSQMEIYIREVAARETKKMNESMMMNRNDCYA